MATTTSMRGEARFHIKRQICDTLQGRIYAAIDLITNQPVVIKEAWRTLVVSGRSRKGHRVPEDFLKERDMVMALTQLSHQTHHGITTGFAKGIHQWDDEQSHYYAMEFCAAELFEYISNTQALHQEFTRSESTKPQIPMHSPNSWVRNVITMFGQICESVHWLHSNGYCHLDLSLENVMISDLKTLKVKLIDFGLAQKFTTDFQFRGRVGKLQYMCPEAYSRKAYDARAADVWCLGIILFMMLIGAPPYSSPNPQNVAFKYIVSGRLRDVLSHWKRLRLVTDDALDLLNKIFKYQKERISLEDVIRHPFLKGADETEEIVSGMSVEAGSQHVTADAGCTDCNKILEQWGLREIADVLHSTGWNEPSQWGQLTLSALKYEIGLTDQQAKVFLEKQNPSEQVQTQRSPKYDRAPDHDRSQSKRQERWYNLGDTEQNTNETEEKRTIVDEDTTEIVKRTSVESVTLMGAAEAVHHKDIVEADNIDTWTSEEDNAPKDDNDIVQAVNQTAEYNRNEDEDEDIIKSLNTKPSVSAISAVNNASIANAETSIHETEEDDDETWTSDEDDEPIKSLMGKPSVIMAPKSEIKPHGREKIKTHDARTVQPDGSANETVQKPVVNSQNHSNKGAVDQTMEDKGNHNDERKAIVDALEQVLNKQLDNLVSAYDKFRCFKQQFLAETDNGIVTCPTHSQNTRSGAYNTCNISNRNSNGNSPPHKHNSNRDTNHSKDTDGGNNNGDEEDEYEEECKASAPCNHLSKCMDCSHVLTRKSEQIKLFKSLVSTLQKQHEYHTSFENMLCSAMQHPQFTRRNRKSKAKPPTTLNEDGILSVNQASYNPSYRAKGNIRISRRLTQSIIPKRIQQPITNVYAYLDRSIGLQYNDGQLLDADHGSSSYKVVHFDLNDNESNQSLYGVIERLPSTQKSCYQWQMHDKLYKSSELSSVSLPSSSRRILVDHMRDIYQYTFNPQSVKEIVRKSKWNAMPVFNRKNNTKRVTLSITKEQLNPLIAKALCTIHPDTSPLIPIVMFGAGSHWIEYLLMVHIERDIDIGVSLKYNKADRAVTITGIHLDKAMISEQHELITPHECHCLDGYQLQIHDIRVGNPDDLVNQVKDYKGRYHAFKQLIYKFVNGKDTEKYEILQQHAQVFIKHDNGSLGGWSVLNPALPSPSTPSVQSISTCSSPPASSVSSMNNNVSYGSESLSNDWSFLQ